ncbi:arsenate reductase/protein-tyrosine-phosphatase family protein [Streptomyces antibioticus]|uniref:arsenate reductase/protein-tyrosine-phosphatase family protein n=1 Tax=Streptomyces antibioticus TaxID=1890 RepID=UPI00224E2037|nr:low molecular weight phosphotyrosine protein phosphatase [Streptomyces antibioticus]MCX4740769.1 low molecular weight phosphotyrosine protein phosphatase [Streptomyces antibioticus]
MRKLLTVCLGNYCRSPLAQIALTRRGGPAVTVRSAGLIGKWQDQPANPSMINAARRLGLDLTHHRGRQITLKDLEWADDVLAMDSSVLDTLHAIDGGHNTHKLRLYLPGRDVPDPMGQDENAFNDCAVVIEAGTSLHISG